MDQIKFLVPKNLTMCELQGVIRYFAATVIFLMLIGSWFGGSDTPKSALIHRLAGRSYNSVSIPLLHFDSRTIPAAVAWTEVNSHFLTG